MKSLVGNRFKKYFPVLTKITACIDACHTYSRNLYLTYTYN
jgi:hypothetical protein